MHFLEPFTVSLSAQTGFGADPKGSRACAIKSARKEKYYPATTAGRQRRGGGKK